MGGDCFMSRMHQLMLIMMQASHLPSFGMALWARQAFNGGPKVLWLISQASSRGELLLAAQSVMIKNGVVGRIGKKTPTMPRASVMMAMMI